MALSNVWSFTVSRDDVIREGMLNIGALGEAETPTAQEVTDCARKLNMLVKQWMGSQDFAPGLKMWERKRGELFLTSTQGVYRLGPNTPDHWAGATNNSQPGYNYGQTSLTAQAPAGTNSLFVASAAGMSVGDQVGIFVGPDLYWTTITAVSPGSNNFQIPGPGIPTAGAGYGATVYNYTSSAQRPLGIVTCLLRDQYGNDTPLSAITVQEYESLPSKAMPQFQTDPTVFYYESAFGNSNTSGTGNGHIYLDMYGAQDTNKFLHIVFIEAIMDLTQPTDNPEYPQQWYRALCWGLSREIAAMFDAEWTQDMQANYDQALAIAREGDPETTALFFQCNDAFGY